MGAYLSFRMWLPHFFKTTRLGSSVESIKAEREEELEKETKMVICACGSIAVKVTAWTNNNPGRRFWSCARNGSNCGFIGWADNPMCPRAVQIIPGLLRSKNKVEEKLKKAESDLVKQKWVIFCSWVFFLLYICNQ